MAHQPDEYIRLDRLYESVRFYAELAEKYLID
jgi:succinyl-diaminopimelate desuccinylase